ncbi:MAG: hypothetical protein QW351_09830, partial [Candidatus Caldarchaeum sp.]
MDAGDTKTQDKVQRLPKIYPHPRSGGLLEGVFHGLTGRPPQPLHGEGYELFLPSRATGLAGG